MSGLPDFGDWGNGPEDEYTPDERMRRIYFAFNAGTLTRYGTVRVPSSWTMPRIRQHGLFSIAEDLVVSYDPLAIKHIIESV